MTAYKPEFLSNFEKPKDAAHLGLSIVFLLASAITCAVFWTDNGGINPKVKHLLNWKYDCARNATSFLEYPNVDSVDPTGKASKHCCQCTKGKRIKNKRSLTKIGEREKITGILKAPTPYTAKGHSPEHYNCKDHSKPGHSTPSQCAKRKVYDSFLAATVFAFFWVLYSLTTSDYCKVSMAFLTVVSVLIGTTFAAIVTAKAMSLPDPDPDEKAQMWYSAIPSHPGYSQEGGAIPEGYHLLSDVCNPNCSEAEKIHHCHDRDNSWAWCCGNRTRTCTKKEIQWPLNPHIGDQHEGHVYTGRGGWATVSQAYTQAIKFPPPDAEIGDRWIQERSNDEYTYNGEHWELATEPE